MRMRRLNGLMAMAALVLAAACAGYNETDSAAGTLAVDSAEAANTVVLHVRNDNSNSMSLHTLVEGQSQFVGSVAGNSTTDILLDPSLFPTGFLYVVAIPATSQGRAVVGPFSASKGEVVRMTVTDPLHMSRATVVKQ